MENYYFVHKSVLEIVIDSTLQSTKHINWNVCAIIVGLQIGQGANNVKIYVTNPQSDSDMKSYGSYFTYFTLSKQDIACQYSFINFQIMIAITSNNCIRSNTLWILISKIIATICTRRLNERRFNDFKVKGM